MANPKRTFFYIVVFAILHCSVFSFAQLDLYPVHYGTVPTVSRLHNPALVGVGKKYVVDVGNQFYTGLYSKVENHYAVGSYNFAKDSNANQSIVGIKWVNEKEGDFIVRPKVYLSYAWHTPVAEGWWLGGAANLGLASYMYKSTAISGGSSSIRPDADFGIALHGPSWTVGMAMNQAFNSELIPKQVAFRWRRFYTFFIEKSIRLGEAKSLAFYTQKQVLPTYPDRNDMGCYFQLHVLEIGTNYYFREKVSLFAGLREFGFLNHQLSLRFCYSFPQTSASQANNQSYELVLTIARK